MGFDFNFFFAELTFLLSDQNPESANALFELQNKPFQFINSWIFWRFGHGSIGNIDSLLFEGTSVRLQRLSFLNKCARCILQLLLPLLQLLLALFDTLSLALELAQIQLAFYFL